MAIGILTRFAMKRAEKSFEDTCRHRDFMLELRPATPPMGSRLR